ncbi:beta-lactamase/transpeptidase-like protein [Coprinellus micaceus]|uniref:Beta-lactamase/transpeptidase-like protein n=1 Tax=Coprinellus micaceus TaxID=71717 RepID=A0A4Y7SWL1_COPMI|nr:beta-lactamase/transpeptidase-like protein [Coprinellus micaceus]
MPSITAQGKASLDAFIDQAGQDPVNPPFVFGVTTAQGEVYFKGTASPKLITHLAAMQLVNSGRLSLSTPVSQYIPEFENLVVIEDVPPIPDLIAQTKAGTPPEPKPTLKYHAAKEVMRIEHLMHHTKQDTPYAGPHDPKDPVGAFLRAIKGGLPATPLKFEPGADWAYGWSSDVLGFVIEKIVGTTLDEYMKAHIFKPLGMTQTSFHQSPLMRANLMSVTLRREGGALSTWDHPFYESDPEKVHLFCGGASILSSARDYLCFLRHLLQIHQETIPPGDAIIPRARLLELLAPSLTGKPLETMQSFLGTALPTRGVTWANGQAVVTEDWPGMRKMGSGFWSGYLNTSHWIDPSTGIAAVFQSQLLPPLDRGMLMLGAQLEMMLYAGLGQ